MKLSLDLNKSNVLVLLRVFAALLLIGVWTMTFYEIEAGRQQQLESAERDAHALARVFEEHTARTVEAVDQAVTFLQYRYLALGSKLDIASELRAGLNPGNIYNLFSIVDERGDVVLSNQAFAPTNLADREHIRVHMDANTAQLFISKPVLGRVSKKWSIQMTRRINGPDGKLKGVVVVSVDPQYFARLYREIGLGSHDSISLVGLDGTVRARHAGGSADHGQDVSSGGLYKAAMANGTGVLRMHSVIDGRDRIFAYRTLKQYPLYVTVGIDLEDQLAPFRAMRAKMLSLAALATCIILAFTAAFIVLVGRLVASREQALAASRAKSRFLSNVSHELRTPLTGILGYSELLKDDLAATEHSAYARAIHESGQRLLAQVDAILEFSALETGRTAPCERRENLRNLLDRAMAAHAADAAAKPLQYALEVAADVPEAINCDGRMLASVLDKLLDNAVRFTDQGAVRLTVTRAAGQLLFQVSDTGSGVPPAARERIFDAFSRADESDACSRGGAGLGLAIAGRMAAMMGGTISLGEASASGSVFIFTLPLNEQDQPRKPPPAE